MYTFRLLQERVGYPALVNGEQVTSFSAWMSPEETTEIINSNSDDRWSLERKYECPVCHQHVVIPVCWFDREHAEDHLAEAHGIGKRIDKLVGLMPHRQWVGPIVTLE